MTKMTRRAVLSSAAAATLSAPFVRPAWAATTELRALMWEAYLLPDTVTAFEDTHQVKLVPSFFDGNSEAYNKLRVGGANEFDLVQADGFWPQLYFREGLIRAVDYSKVAGHRGLSAGIRRRGVQGADGSGVGRESRLPVLLGGLWHHL